jgi:hypothetical protein
LLSPFVDGAIGLTVTPFAFGFLVFSLAATLAAAWANKTRVPVPAT